MINFQRKCLSSSSSFSIYTHTTYYKLHCSQSGFFFFHSLRQAWLTFHAIFFLFITNLWIMFLLRLCYRVSRCHRCWITITHTFFFNSSRLLSHSFIWTNNQPAISEHRAPAHLIRIRKKFPFILLIAECKSMCNALFLRS